ncbi:MAG: hypothetical protein DRP02_12495 [Candidatus Gerdarchaeota archaeon]|nr:MAG: hypothetical protein DRO63_03725 [Candidatus Gerdarchaeota archaeon]RLI68504.1 MAG: hypothetical protein DRP02_12495 [Candidatus Gerdarchaeota archaeon]
MPVAKKSNKMGFLVTFGTDTMAWGLSALRYLLKNLPANVAITGSQVPFSVQFSSSDVYPNIETSIKLLTQLTGPEIFVVFNNGKAAFRDALWKYDKWSPDAFRGEELAEISLDEIKIHGRSYPLNPNRRLDRLYLIRTGGTIESEYTTDGVLRPKSNLLTEFIEQRFHETYKEFKSIPLLAVDSSEMIFEYWKKIAKSIAKESRENGYTTFCDEAFDTRVQIVSCSPFMTEDDYKKAFSQASGIILNAYGSGTINADLKSGFSPMPAITDALAQGKFVVIASHTPFGAQDFIYANAWEPIKVGALPAGDFSIAHCQIKLAYLLGHKKIIAKTAKRYGLRESVLLKLAFLAGIDFRSNTSRKKYEQLLGAPIPLEDPFFNLPFEVALEKIIRFIRKKETEQITIDSLKTFEEAFDRFFSTPAKRNRWAVILKPDTVIGANKWGELIDAAKNLAIITSELLNWNIVTIELSQIPYKAFLEVINMKCKRKETIGEFLRTFRYVIVEGGRQSLYDEKSFEEISGGKFARADYLHLLKSLMQARQKTGAAPALYLCLGHQGIAEMLKQELVNLLKKKEEILAKVKQVDEKSAEHLKEILEKISSLAGKMVVKRRDGTIIAKDLQDEFFAVKQNELPEMGLKKMVRFEPKKDLPAELLQAYKKVAKMETGLLEDYYSLESLDIVMLHNDEVNEEAILYFNWAFQLLWKFSRAHFKVLVKEPILEELLALPMGLEIPSSTYYSLEKESVLTEIGGMTLYYYNHRTKVVKRDYALQFHPELFEEIKILQKRDFESKTLLELSDGIQLLLATLQAGLVESMKI